MPHVRVLSDAVINGISVKCNQVAAVSDDIAAALEAAGQVDSNADAVDYALSLSPDVVDCSPAPGEPEPPADPEPAAEPEPAPAKPGKAK